MVKELKNEGDVERLVIGATVLGTGGGGDPKEGYKALSGVLKEKEKPIEIADLESLPSDGVVVVPYYVGSIAPGLKPKKPVVIKDPISTS
jgi:DUF917 family protein